MRVKVDAQINTGTLQLDAKTLAQDLAEEYKMRAAMAASGEVLSLRDSLAKQEVMFAIYGKKLMKSGRISTCT